TGAENYCDNQPTDFVFDFNEVVVGAGVTVSGCYGFDLGVTADFDIGLGKLNYFELIFSNHVVNALALDLTPVDFSAPSLEYALIHWDIPAPIPTAPPIPATLGIALAVSVSMEAEAAVSLGISTTFTSETGVILDHGDLTLIRNVDPSFSPIGPVVTANGAIKGGIGPEVSYKICNIAGPQLALAGFTELGADINDNPWWSLDAGIEATFDLAITLNSIPGLGALPDNWGLNYNFGTWPLARTTVARADGPFASANSAPVADIGVSPATSVETGTIVNLDGSGSYDPDGDNITHTWTLTRPAGSSAALISPTSLYPSFTPDVAGTYTVRLVVNDGEIEGPAATAVVTAATTPNDVDDDSDGYSENQGDCNDGEAAIHPGATEVCGDGIDQDCSGTDLACSVDPNSNDICNLKLDFQGNQLPVGWSILSNSSGGSISNERLDVKTTDGSITIGSSLSSPLNNVSELSVTFSSSLPYAYWGTGTNLTLEWNDGSYTGIFVFSSPQNYGANTLSARINSTAYPTWQLPEDVVSVPFVYGDYDVSLSVRSNAVAVVVTDPVTSNAVMSTTLNGSFSLSELAAITIAQITTTDNNSWSDSFIFSCN
ncbi:MAG: MopE-related protein, partial [bacterium]|nr:MopE-related protein [bacterium]